MGETTDQIERQIEQNRNQLSDDFSELGQRMKSMVDWRTQFEARPGTMLALAFGGGMLVSAILGGTRSSRKFNSAAWLPDSRRPENRNSAPRSSPDHTHGPSPVRDDLEALSGAFLGVAASRATSFFDRLLPGFEREFTRMRETKRSDRLHSDRSCSEAPPNLTGQASTTGHRD